MSALIGVSPVTGSSQIDQQHDRDAPPPRVARAPVVSSQHRRPETPLAEDTKECR
jgi:hypothetical protein